MRTHCVFLTAATSTLLSLSPLGGGSRVARADGAIPDSQAVLLSSEHPERIVLAANFGLVFSEDGGATWEYACESAATVNGRLYSMGAPPDERLFTLSDRGVPSSVDLGCTWTLGGGPFEGGLVLDYFADPTNPARVWLAAEAPGLAGRQPAALYLSNDGGVSYGPAIFTAPAGGGISGAEIARSDSATGYLAVFQLDPTDGLSHPSLHRTSDGGASWEAIDLEPSLGRARVSIAAVDPNDANRIFLRVSGTNEQMRSVDSIAVSTDGGHSFEKPVNLTGGTIKAFFVRRNGTVLVSGLLGATVVGYRSRDAGATFATWQSGLHPRGFGERGTTLYVATDDSIDGFALASSEDDGDTFTPRLRFRDIHAVKACVYQACVIDCTMQASRDLFAPAACGGGAAPDGGTPNAGKTGGGCGACALFDGGIGSEPIGLAVAALVAGGVLARRRRRPRRSRRSSWLSLLVATAALASPSSANAYVRAKTSAGVAERWSPTCISLEIHLGGLPGVSDEEMRTAVSEAARVWTGAAQSCTAMAIALAFVDGPGPPVRNDGVNVIGAGSDGWCAATDGSAPSTTTGTCNSPSATAATSVFAGANGRLLGGDTELNTLTFAWGALDGQGQPADRQDLQSALVHEIGHLVGLDHACWSGIGPHAIDDRGLPVPDCYGAPAEILADTMYPTIDPGDISKRSLSSEAVRALCEIYPAAPGAAPAACPAPPSTSGGCNVGGAARSPPVGWSAALLMLLVARGRRPRRIRP